MATKAKKDQSSEKAVTRISATDERSKKPLKKVTSEKAKKKKEPRAPKAERGGILGYFIGAWKELRQVRWPNRRATWSLTGAVLAFTAFFIAFILLIDAAFKYLFELILK